MNKKHEFETLSFTELMMKPKPELCDYIMLLREPDEPAYQTNDIKPEIGMVNLENTDNDVLHQSESVNAIGEYLKQNGVVMEETDAEDTPEHTKKKRGRKKRNG